MGILAVADERFEEALRTGIGPWLDGDVEVLLSGMITSRNGWVETPYIDVPAGLAAVRSGVVGREIGGGARLSFLPGVCQRSPTPDVMRGEEIQIFGAFGQGESGVAVLPGTHSKWAAVDRGRITGFRSFMTGEVFAALQGHTILGRLIPEGAPAADPAAFLAGVRQGAEAGSPGLLGDIFSTRSGVLLGAFPPAEIAERLSGLLIGHEIAGARRLGWTSGPVTLIGEAPLCARYGSALAALGISSRPGPADAAVEGFRRLATF
jgi:2-dehydro-3-deoxygalactonokinase